MTQHGPPRANRPVPIHRRLDTGIAGPVCEKHDLGRATDQGDPGLLGSFDGEGRSTESRGGVQDDRRSKNHRVSLIAFVQRTHEFQ